MSFAEAYNGSVATSIVAGSVRQSRFRRRRDAPRLAGLIVAAHRLDRSTRDIRRNGRLRRGTVAVVVRLMACAFLRRLSQPADYDTLVASAAECKIPRHTTCSSHRNAICPANDSRTLGHEPVPLRVRDDSILEESVTRIQRFRLYPRPFAPLARRVYNSLALATPLDT